MHSPSPRPGRTPIPTRVCLPARHGCTLLFQTWCVLCIQVLFAAVEPCFQLRSPQWSRWCYSPFGPSDSPHQHHSADRMRGMFHSDTLQLIHLAVLSAAEQTGAGYHSPAAPVLHSCAMGTNSSSGMPAWSLLMNTWLYLRNAIQNHSVLQEISLQKYPSDF